MNSKLGLERILVATAFSPPAEAAFQQTVWVARKMGPSITLPTLQYSPPDAGPNRDLYLERLVNEGQSFDNFELDATLENDAQSCRLAEKIGSAIDVQAKVCAGESYAEIIHAVLR